MSNETIEMRQVSESGDYTVYDGPTVAGVQALKGLAVIDSAAEKLGDYMTVELSDEAEVTLVPEKFTGATGRYATEGGAIRHAYFHPSVLEPFGFEQTEGEDGEQEVTLPESIGITLSPSSEDAYEASVEEAQADAEDEAEGLVSGDSEADSDEETVEISDEEAGLVDAE